MRLNDYIEQEQTVYTVHEWGQMIFTVLKWGQIILQYAYFQDTKACGVRLYLRQDQNFKPMQLMHAVTWLAKKENGPNKLESLSLAYFYSLVQYNTLASWAFIFQGITTEGEGSVQLTSL